MNKIWNFAKDNWVIILTAIYVLSPVDLIPNAVAPVLGVLDDLGVIGLAALKVQSDKKKAEKGE